MVVIVVILINPTAVLVILEEEGGAGNSEANSFSILVKNFCELLEARVGLSFSLHI